MAECMNCDGTGDCPEMCGADEECTVCGGTGRCPVCDGTGDEDDEEPEE